MFGVLMLCGERAQYRTAERHPLVGVHVVEVIPAGFELVLHRCDVPINLNSQACVWH